MEDSLLIDAVERFVKGEMSAQEKIYFEDLRKNNPDLDQTVVEHLFFLNELDKFSDNKNVRQKLNEVQGKLKEEGFITTSPQPGGGRVVQMWKKYKRTIAVAASIAGLVSIFIAGLVTAVTKKTQPDLTYLVKELKEQDAKTNQMRSEINKLKQQSNSQSLSVPAPVIESKFRATGFMIDANNNYIVTNAHVITAAKHQLIIENNKGEQFAASPVYVNNLTDIAILQVKDKAFKKLPSLPYQIRKTNAELGEQVFMLGFPKQEIVYGEGYVSARNGFRMDTIFCQLSTTANEGNSGSPVISKSGELVGVITSMETNADGVVFAIKSSNIHNAVEEVKKLNDHESIKINSSPSLKGMDRKSQIRKMEDYVFMIKGN
jgi:serine protease Do